MTAATTAAFLVSAHKQDASRFEHHVLVTQARIEYLMEANVALLRGMAGLFATGEDISPEQFHAYVERLELKRLNPGVQGIGFTQRISHEEKEAWFARRRAAGFPVFLIWPEGVRKEYHSVLYLEPQDAHNQVAVGYDMFTEPTRRAAMTRAWSTGVPALSGKVSLVQEPDEHKQPGLLLYVPVYRGGHIPADEAQRQQALEGFVYSSFQAADLFSSAFATEDQPRVSFHLYDGLEARPEHLLYESLHAEQAQAGAAAYTSTVQVEVAGRTWTLVVTSLPVFERTLLAPWSRWVAGAGFLFSLMVFAFLRANEKARDREVAKQLRARQALESSREEARRSAARLQAITDALPALVAYIDHEERYRFANRAYVSWFGVRPDTLLGKRVEELIGERGYAQVRDYMHQALAGKTVHFESELTLKDGRTLYVQPNYIPDRDGQGTVRGYVALVHDITERKRAEETVRKAVRLRDEFLSVASHELKTPLTSLSLKLQALARDAQAQPESPFVLKVRGHVEVARKQSKRLSDLVGDLLDVSRISSGQMTLYWERLDFTTVTREVASRLEAQATKVQSNLTLQVPESLEGVADRMRVEQVLENLLTNAIKYGASKPIHVRLEARDEWVVLTVRDQGIGIAPEHQTRIFERFERAVSEKNYGGLGLGLYITRTIVEALDGRISVESIPGQGASFTVELPRKPMGE